MRKRNYIIIGILTFFSLVAMGGYFVLDGLSSMGNPNGNSAPDYPYFITTETLNVKKIVLPKRNEIYLRRTVF